MDDGSLKDCEPVDSPVSLQVSNSAEANIGGGGMRKILKSLILLSVSLLISLAVVEVAVRTVIDDGMQYDLEMWKYAKQMKRVSASPGIGHEHQPGTSAHLMGADVSINSTGQRDRDFVSPKPTKTVRILMLGDSLTFGWGVPQDQTVPKRLEALLNASGNGRTYEVVNAGVGNYNLAMSANWMLERGMAFEPDLVVFNYFINDAEVTPRRQGGGLREWSYAFTYFAGRFDSLLRRSLGGTDWLEYYRALYSPESQGWAATKSHFRKLVEFSRGKGAPLVFVNYPELRTLAPYPFAKVSEAIAALPREHGVPYLDLLDAIRDEDPPALWVTPADPHPSAYADQLFARAIHGFLRQQPGF